jgi:hypothetical protein
MDIFETSIVHLEAAGRDILIYSILAKTCKLLGVHGLIVFLLHYVVALKRAVLIFNKTCFTAILLLKHAHRGYDGRAGCPSA